MLQSEKGQLFDAIWFNVDVRAFPDLSIKKARLVYRLDINEFRGEKSLQLKVEYLKYI